MTGEKDGPLAKVGFVLALLYYEAQVPSLETHGLGTPPERIAVDAIAVEDGEALLEDLERLGLEDGAAYGSLLYERRCGHESRRPRHSERRGA